MPHKQWGHANYFSDRHKWKILDLAEAKPSDVVVDLGCGDASFLIFAVKFCGVRSAIGYENMPQRLALSRRNVKRHKLTSRIAIYGNDINDDAKLDHADIILDMLPQGWNDDPAKTFESIRRGTRIIKHDLPYIGFIPDKIDYPFYRHVSPLVEADNSEQWAARVLPFLKHPRLNDVWHELYYYGYEKGYSKWDIKDFAMLAKKRFG